MKMDSEKYLPELMAEKNTLDPSFVHAVRLLAHEIEKYEGDELRRDVDVKKYLDIISNKNIKLSERVLIPVQQYPKFNFVGKLLGPRGNSMKRLQEETGVKMSILGKGSMRDKEKDYNDEIRQEQLRELSLLNGSDDSNRGRAAQGRSTRPATTTSTRVHRGAGRSTAAPRALTTVTHGKLPTTIATREAQAQRARGAAGSAAYRPPLLAATHESYDDYGYDDGYGGEYDDESYESYEDGYSNPSKSVSDFHEYGYRTGDESYNNYEDEWPTSRPNLKAPVLRLTRGGYRKQPYDTKAVSFLKKHRATEHWCSSAPEQKIHEAAARRLKAVGLGRTAISLENSSQGEVLNGRSDSAACDSPQYTSKVSECKGFN
ncbi:KH domain-containing, RNA-binding, signal transduction-associated protein 2 isoform X3 [Synchiropus splendidus]|uniref:KH domain-containing, RNA-binding, signal transduction-associated protein 2 isoform X3 n=1 Tax=Synchiropus splendidus TaxID=270530 RepID=UPI00237D49B5|nr:KH domain-containing, RNA-binding, signal transduction-associated protein 2 isoform X3 [Synchiropus splendidus]